MVLLDVLHPTALQAILPGLLQLGQQASLMPGVPDAAGAVVGVLSTRVPPPARLRCCLRAPTQHPHARAPTHPPQPPTLGLCCVKRMSAHPEVKLQVRARMRVLGGGGGRRAAASTFPALAWPLHWTSTAASCGVEPGRGVAA